MTGPSQFELLDLATPYALHAIPDAERASIERLVAAAPAPVAEAFRDEVRAVRETMAAVSAATPVEPPPALRDRLLAAVGNKPARHFPWRTTLLASAAAVVIGLGALSAGLALRPAKPPSTAEQVFAAPDVHHLRRDPHRRHRDRRLLASEERRRAGDEQRRAAGGGHRLPDVVAGRPRPPVGRHDGRKGRRAVDHRGTGRPRQLECPGVHGRAR